jgi:D-alanyl-D-alanine carboxypeptidase
VVFIRGAKRQVKGAPSVAAALLVLLLSLALAPAASAGASTPSTLQQLQQKLDALVARSDGPPGIVVVVQNRGQQSVLHAGTGVVGQQLPISATDTLRFASVAKAYSGAAALALVAKKKLSLRSTVGRWLPSLPQQWHQVTLAQLLQHTSGIADFSQTDGFREAVTEAPYTPPPPIHLLSFAQHRLLFTPGSRYKYSNSDNIIVALMVEEASHQSYTAALQSLIFSPLGVTHTSLPAGAAMPSPFAHGYAVDPPEPPTDVTDAFAAGWAWASGGIVGTPADLNTFVRAYVRGSLTNAATRAAQFRFRPGKSEPPGPGTNAAGLGLFRYSTPCGTVYGHTGNTAGFTQFTAASGNGSRSVVVSINAQITPTSNAAAFPALRQIDQLAVCAALAG